MERNCLRSSFRYQRVNTTSIAGGGGGGPNTAAVKGPRNKLCRAAEEDFMNGISWPPRSYTCNFCKREFRSAQALGGHMNVHRRDRAMLYSPPTDGQFTNLNLNLQYNPNPNSNPNLSSPRSTFETNNDDGSFGCPFDWKASDLKTSRAEIAKPNVFERAHCCGDHWNKGEKFIGLDIEISTNKDIDLELRLGYSAKSSS